MAIYTKKKCEEMLLEMGYEPCIDPEVLDESAIDLLGDKEEIILAALATAAVITVVGITTKNAIDFATIKKAIKIYPELHPECKQISEYDRQIYKLKKKRMDEPGKKYGRVFGFLVDKLGFDKCVCYFDGNKLAMLYANSSKWVYDGSDCNGNRYYHKETHICRKFESEMAKSHSDYYTACFFKELHVKDKEAVKWAKQIVKENRSENK